MNPPNDSDVYSGSWCSQHSTFSKFCIVRHCLWISGMTPVCPHTLLQAPMLQYSHGLGQVRNKFNISWPIFRIFRQKLLQIRQNTGENVMLRVHGFPTNFWGRQIFLSSYYRAVRRYYGYGRRYYGPKQVFFDRLVTTWPVYRDCTISFNLKLDSPGPICEWIFLEVSNCILLVSYHPNTILSQRLALRHGNRKDALGGVEVYPLEVALNQFEVMR